MVAFEHFGLQDTVSLSKSAQQACGSRKLLAIKPAKPLTAAVNSEYVISLTDKALGDSFNYLLVIQASLYNNYVQFNIYK